jgi:hypothetical protein
VQVGPSFPQLALDPIREAVQVQPNLAPDAVFADAPGGWPVIAALRWTGHWRAVAAGEAP